MSAADKAKHAVDELAGKAKEATGDATEAGNRNQQSSPAAKLIRAPGHSKSAPSTIGMDLT